MAASSPEPESIPFTERLRRAALFVLFAFALLIPKALELPRRRVLWNSLRAVAGLIGALLLVNGIAGEFCAAKLLAGSLLLLLAAVARPARRGETLDELRKATGGLVVVNGGFYTPAAGPRQRVHLVVGATRLDVVNLELQRVEEISLETLSAVQVEPAAAGWQLILRSADREAVFGYEGFFAEHLARVAESTLRSARSPALKVLK